MDEFLVRSAPIYGEAGTKRLQSAHVAVVGLGGVGSYAAEAVIRAGVGEVTLLDADAVSQSNRNRQLCALSSTVGLYKTEVTAARARDINPEITLHTLTMTYEAQTRERLFSLKPDYIIDAIDTVTAKLDLIETAHARGIPILSALGTGNKLDPARLRLADIYETSVCPLARVLRRELKRRGIAAHEVVFSDETPAAVYFDGDGRHAPGSVSWVPGAAGLIMAGAVVRRLSGLE